jgi:hypothetical protein
MTYGKAVDENCPVHWPGCTSGQHDCIEKAGHSGNHTCAWCGQIRG